MFYRCGKLDEYNFIYDSDDSSCELVESSRIGNSLVRDEYIRGSFSIAKLRTMYHLETDIFGFNRVLCRYIVNFHSIGECHIDVSFRVFGIVKYGAVYSGAKNELQLVRFGNESLFMFLSIYLAEDFCGTITSVPRFRSIGNDVYFCGYPIPMQMFVYIMKLARENNFSGIDNALNGALYRNLMTQIGDRLCCAENIIKFEWLLG